MSKEMKLLGLFIVVMFVLALGGKVNAHHDAVVDADADALRFVTVMVLVEGNNGKSWTGTAFHIGGGRFVTAGHVVDGAKRVLLRTANGTILGDAAVVSYKLEGGLDGADWGILQMDPTLGWDQVPALEPGCDYVAHVGDVGAAAGFPHGEPTLTVIVKLWWSELWLFNNAFAPGASGGPVIVGGEAVGIVTSVVSTNADNPKASFEYSHVVRAQPMSGTGVCDGG